MRRHIEHVRTRTGQRYKAPAARLEIGVKRF
jgi:hypothetical protein